MNDENRGRSRRDFLKIGAAAGLGAAVAVAGGVVVAVGITVGVQVGPGDK